MSNTVARGLRTRWVLLALLATEGPLNGFQLRNLIRHRLRFFWDESFGQIYPTLRQLEAEGLITKVVQSGRKTSWSIEPEGRQAVKEWMKTPPREEYVRWELLLRVMFGNVGDLEDLRRYVAEFHDRILGEIELLSGYIKELEQLPVVQPPHLFIGSAIECGLATYRAWVAWSESFLRQFNQPLTKIRKNQEQGRDHEHHHDQGHP